MDSLLGPSGYAVWEDTPPLLRPALSGEERAPSAEGCVPPCWTVEPSAWPRRVVTVLAAGGKSKTQGPGDIFSRERAKRDQALSFSICSGWGV